jgi:hypothetical protein
VRELPVDGHGTAVERCPAKARGLQASYMETGLMSRLGWQDALNPGVRTPEGQPPKRRFSRLQQRRGGVLASRKT